MVLAETADWKRHALKDNFAFTRENGRLEQEDWFDPEDLASEWYRTAVNIVLNNEDGSLMAKLTEVFSDANFIALYDTSRGQRAGNTFPEASRAALIKNYGQALFKLAEFLSQYHDLDRGY